MKIQTSTQIATAKKRKNLGFSNMELMIYLAIASVAIVFLFNRVASARQSNQVVQESANVQTIITASQQAFAGQADYSTITWQVIKATGGFPTQMVVGANPVKVWNGLVTLSNQTVPGAVVTKAQLMY